MFYIYIYFLYICIVIILPYYNKIIKDMYKFFLSKLSLFMLLLVIFFKVVYLNIVRFGFYNFSSFVVMLYEKK